jgi:C1A family cysteine protease
MGTAVSAKRPKAHELTHAYTFAQYTRDFGKKYSATEYRRREGLFRAELTKVLAHNADTTQLWRQGVNHMSDWTVEEKQKMHKGARPKDGKVQPLKHLPGAHKMGDTGVPLPIAVDWRRADPPVLTAVKDQGQCGSCWAHATAEGVEVASTRATGVQLVLSQQQITSCTDLTQNGCNGGWPKVT